MKLKELFQPIRIGNKMVKNRIALPPMILGEATPDGYVTSGMIRRYRDIAEGGIGLMVVEGVSVDSPGAKGIGGLIAHTKNMQGFNKIAEAISLNGAVGVMQVLHCGRQALPEANDGIQPVSVSETPYWMGTKFAPKPRAATLEDLEQIKAGFIDAALLAQQAGFSGVEIHCAHGYILATFLSAKANNRTDRYGGDFAARMKYPLEVVQAVRQAVDDNFIVGARISANYAIPGEPEVDEMLKFAKALEEIGIDYLSVSGGTYESHWKQSPPCYIGRNSNIEESTIIKRALKIPVLVAGGICYPEEANIIIKEQKADLVCMGRAIFADPHLPNKIKMDQIDEIRPCIRCNLEFADTFRQHQAKCSVNFRMGRESEYELTPALKKKHVMIIGGGPGGMEAARVAALRGHRVDIYEKDQSLGGKMIVASAPAHKEEIGRLRAYFIRQMELQNVNVHVGIEATPQLVKEIDPDALIIATGARPSMPPIPGIDSVTVLNGEDVLMSTVEVEGKTVVIGGGCVGIDVVMELTAKNQKVILVEQADVCGTELDVISWSAVDLLFKNLVEEGLLELYTASTLKTISPGSIVLETEKGSKTLNYDNLVLALGYTPARDIVEQFENLIPQTYQLGDAVDARRIRHAVHEGFVVGYNV